MNRNRIISATTAVGLVSLMLLLYWVFGFLCMTVFGLRVFRENTSEAFGMSILGILALLAGSLILNIIMNLSKIADALATSNQSSEVQAANFPKSTHVAMALLLFPVIAFGLFLGDRVTTKNRERNLIEGAQAVLKEYPKEIASLANYSYSREYVERAGQVLAVLAKTIESAPSVRVIVPDRIDEQSVILAFDPHEPWRTKVERKKTDYIYSCSAEELKYLKGVFAGTETTHRFTASKGTYKLYFPVRQPARTIVIFFSDQREYGKFGS